LLFPVLIFAHENTGSGFVAGFSHPILGLDHLLAMISVGVLSAQMGGRAIWTVPATFVAFMLVGGLMGIGSNEESYIEPGIALSVVLLGLAIGFQRNFPTFLVMGFVALFGALHGFAHGVEMPSIAHPMYYSFGFVIGTIGIHLAGVLIGNVGTSRPQMKMLLRFTGVFVAGMGMQMLIG
ncbi:MAG: urease accessory protein, partial [Bacteroidia bacterium]